MQIKSIYFYVQNIKVKHLLAPGGRSESIMCSSQTNSELLHGEMIEHFHCGCHEDGSLQKPQEHRCMYTDSLKSCIQLRCLRFQHIQLISVFYKQPLKSKIGTNYWQYFPQEISFLEFLK